MKKGLLTIMAVAAAGSVMADLAINWNSNTTGILQEGGTEVGLAGPWVQDGAIIQLIWSATENTDYNVSSVMPGAPMNSGEFLLASSTTGTGGNFANFGLWGLGLSTYDDGNIGGTAGASTLIHTGFFYTRVFQDATADAGDFYLETQGLAANLVFDSNNPSSTSYTDPVFSGTSVGIDDNATTVIPEPATIGMMGIAGLGMFLARKKSRR